MMIFDRSNIQQLLRYALTERDSQAITYLLHFMSDIPEVEPVITAQLDQWLTTEPDAVYFFGRTALSVAFDDKWLPYLWASARASLQIVVTQSDSESIMEWLRLIAREPASYQLNDILREGIRLAQIRAHDDGTLGVRLLNFALKRACDLVLDMLNDPPFISALNPPIGIALSTFDPEAVAKSIETGRDLGILALSHALKYAPTNPKVAMIFTPEIIAYIWALYGEEESFTYLIPDFKPSTLIHTLLDASTSWLSEESVHTLFVHTVNADDESLFIHLCYQLTHQDHAQLLAYLNTLYLSGQIAPETIIRSLTRLQEATILSTQEITTILYQLGGLYEWKNTAGKMIIEYLGRLFQQNAGIQLPLEGLRKLHKLTSELRQEPLQKTFLKRIQAMLETQSDDAPPLDFIIELQETVAWSNTLQNHFLSWWRGYMLTQPLSRLQFIEKSFENKRQLETLRGIVQTTIAIRKFLGKRTLSEVAMMVNGAFTLLQMLSDSFDPINNRPLDFDVPTFQMEIANRANDLTAQEREVFAKDLRELAELISTMADYRSKSTLIRREDDIERQLMSGEQDPQSAIDTMRWLAGFLGRM
ncbi:MAG: hypothetical protein CUN52_01070 [Phototrophicales bacterium]|nr:MAG: hypothetical protein CUN52_01070 [Phototrophicales bacterium]